MIISRDVDEIPPAVKVKEYVNRKWGKVFEQLWTNYYLNYLAVTCDSEIGNKMKNGFCQWKGTAMMDYNEFRSAKETRMMRSKNPDAIIDENGGWHFSFIGGYKEIRKKLDAWSHSKENIYSSLLYDEAAVMEIVKSGKDLFCREFVHQWVSLGTRLPRYVTYSREKVASTMLYA